MFKQFINRFLHGYMREKSEVEIARELGVKVGHDCIILDDPRKVFSTEPYLISLGNHVEITSGVRFLPHERLSENLSGFIV